MDFDRNAIAQAHSVIQESIVETPLLANQSLSTFASRRTIDSNGNSGDFTPQMELFFKLENLQKTGSFKYRGVLHTILRLTEEELRRGLITESTGNHGKALACAAQQVSKEKGFPIRVHVVMPSTAPTFKVEAIRAYSAKVTLCKSWSPTEKMVTIASIQAQSGGIYISSTDHPGIILGQGTIALELQTQMEALGFQDGTSGLDAVIAPCGGGGLLSGVAIALKDTPIQVYGAEVSSTGVGTISRAREAGVPPASFGDSQIADGLRAPLGRLPWSFIRDKELVKCVFAVDDKQIEEAMRRLMPALQTVIEPSAAVPLAVALFNPKFRAMVAKDGRTWKIGIVLSGGNIAAK